MQINGKPVVPGSVASLQNAYNRLESQSETVGNMATRLSQHASPRGVGRLRQQTSELRQQIVTCQSKPVGPVPNELRASVEACLGMAAGNANRATQQALQAAETTLQSITDRERTNLGKGIDELEALAGNPGVTVNQFEETMQRIGLSREYLKAAGQTLLGGQERRIDQASARIANTLARRTRT